MKNRNPIKDIAYNYAFKNPSTQLQVWWSWNFKRPLFHDSLGDYSEEELLTEYYIFKLIDDPDFRDEYMKDSGIKPEDKEEDEQWFKKMQGDAYVATKDDEVHETY